MLKVLSRLVFWISGWKLGPIVIENIPQSVLIAAPHTSNWDLVFARCAFFIMGVPLRFTIKKEWMRFPFNYLMGPLGAIPIDRTPKDGSLKKRNMVDVMADLFKANDHIVVLVTPEGTRSKNSNWKSGFYHTAVKAGVPIACGYLDYSKKEAGIGLLVQPTGNFDEDIQMINDFYAQIRPKFPKKFSIHLGAKSRINPS